MSTTDWLLFGILLAIIGHGFVSAIDHQAAVAQLGEIKSALYRLRDELEKLRTDQQGR